MTYNLIVWDNPETLPVPEDCKHLMPKDKWGEVEWTNNGLPIQGAKYTVNGGRLYLQETADGKTDVKQQDFTGQIVMYGYFIDTETKDVNHLLSFKVIFCKGELNEISLAEDVKQSFSSYQEALNTAVSSQSKRIKMVRSYWYRFLYTPYFLIVRTIYMILSCILWVLRKALEKVVFFITPW